MDRLMRELADMWFPLYVAAWYVLYLAVCSRAARLFTSEKEGQTLPVLLASPLGDASILRGKYLVLMREYGPSACCLLVMNLVVSLWLLDMPMPLYLAWTTLGPLVRVAFFATISLWWSVISETSTRATTGNILSQVVLHFSVLFLWGSALEEIPFPFLLTLGYLAQIAAVICVNTWMTANLRPRLTED